MELTLPSERPSARETAALLRVLGPPDSPWRGGERRGDSARIAIGLGHERAARRSLLLPALLAVQQECGWISRGSIRAISKQLEVPPAEVWGVVTFYGLLETEPPQGEIVHVCTDLACPTGEARIHELRAGGVDARPSPCLGRCDHPCGEFRPADPVDAAASATLIGGTVRLLAEGEPYAALRRAVQLSPGEVIDAVEAAGLVGRGGAAFPVGVKWRAASSASAQERFVVCNADESEPGTFKDLLLLNLHADSVLEGLIIAGYAIGASKGFVYVRGEYPDARAAMERAVARAAAHGFLGPTVGGTVFSFEVEVRSGAGAYICGEETALLNSIEGYRGEPRVKPPFPTEVGLFGRPTVINNVETLANVSRILVDGPDRFRQEGTAPSPGTKLFSVSGDVARPGVYELPMGTPLRELLAMAGAVDPRAVLLGGAAGSFVENYDIELSFEGAKAAGASLGSGAVVVFGPDTNFEAVCQRIAEFFADESCGQCVPCRVGTVRQSEALASDDSDRLRVLSDIDRVMTDASICGLGQMASTAIRSAIRLGLLGGAS